MQRQAFNKTIELDVYGKVHSSPILHSTWLMEMTSTTLHAHFDDVAIGGSGSLLEPAPAPIPARYSLHALSGIRASLNGSRRGISGIGSWARGGLKGSQCRSLSSCFRSEVGMSTVLCDLRTSAAVSVLDSKNFEVSVYMLHPSLGSL
eukprot:CAMPEP_0205853632 /NCGR_PEP_ID=MMETSP1083-20121108/1657_1 /ASSEMBLY_ACC=CAM_ASM_000430 /TAXON_ID=97485 /ORGANISM="Prymnesium parvum, Strain Texoma1" /LENGTH=147 /DNA_ID=CAMNT_0053214917 /DNA_START=251 /DNA_END=694 /DNA_ORIENTATION=-